MNPITKYSERHLNRGSPELEEGITSQIKNLIKTSVGKDRLARMKELQIEFLINAAERVFQGTNRDNTYSDYIELMDELMAETHFTCNASKFQANPNQEFIVVTGHFGIAKSTKFSLDELRKSLALKIHDSSWIDSVGIPPNNEPFPLRKAAIFKALYLIFGKKNIAPHEVHMCYPYPFDEIQKDCGVVTLKLDKNKQYVELEQQMDFLFSTANTHRKIPIAIISPEVGTSGKRSLPQNPYELGKFKTGFAVYAAHRKALILPIVQVVNEKAEFNTHVFNPIKPPSLITQETLRDFAEEIRMSMQNEISLLLAG